MKKRILAIGSVLIIFAVLGYTISPGLITKEINNLTGENMDTHMTSSILSQIGIPTIDEMVKVTQYSFVGLGISGIGGIIVGIISKKSKPQFVIPKTESAHQVEHDEIKGKSSALNTLQESLAKGEITSSQYQNLKRLLEEDNRKSTK
ncbi:MAG: SHOCT domain-containing protein [Nitrosotalea sp.]